ncbi:MAG: DHH family phosphoesterase [Bulleidia sp.]
MKWKVIEADGKGMSETYNVGILTGKLLEASGFEDQTIRGILNSDERITVSKAPCVVQACLRIMDAKKKHEKIFVGGDYDADGICSTAIMKYTLDALGIENGYYIPDRFKEGYGLHAHTVKLAYDKGYRLIMTVDNGVKAHEALLEAKRLGMDVIVTDHHTIEEEIEADIVVHPDYMEPEYAYLSGAGVAYQLALNLIGEVDLLTALCGTALIGDVMPLYRATRTIVKRALTLLNQGFPKPLTALLYRPGQCTETDIAFSIVPKLNSIGRMDDSSNVNTLIPYLLSTDVRQIEAYCASLNRVNDKRKTLSAAMSKRALEIMDETSLFPIVHDPSFHEGICGLVAGKLANTCHKPVLVMSECGDVYKGSGRSVEGFDLFSFLSAFTYKEAFGGHKAAVGITVAREHMEDLVSYVNGNIREEDLAGCEAETPAVRIDVSDITFDTVSDLSVLSPYPKDLIQPYFAIVNPPDVEMVQAGKTVRYPLGSNIEAVIFPSKGIEPVKHPHLMIGTLGINRFRGKVTLQLGLEHIA